MKKISPAGLLLLLAVLLLPMSTGAAEQVFFYHNDALGSPVAMTDMNGNVVWRADYEPFGNVSALVDNVPGGNTHQFIGKEADQETGLHHLGARYYDAGLGRFLSVDQAIHLKIPSATLAAPQVLNTYTYSLNNPYRYVDRNGANPVLVAAAAILLFPDTLEQVNSSLGFIGKTAFLQAGFGLGNLLKGIQEAFTGGRALVGSLLTRVGLGEQVLKGETTLYRAVKSGELADIDANGVYQSLPGQVEGKYFYTSADDAARFGRDMYRINTFEGPYTITSTTVPNLALQPASELTLLGEGNAVFLPSSSLPNTAVQILSSSPIP
jgi:RHS repeat-associated protein